MDVTGAVTVVSGARPVLVDPDRDRLGELASQPPAGTVCRAGGVADEVEVGDAVAAAAVASRRVVRGLTRPRPR